LARFAAKIPGGKRLSARHRKKGEKGIWPRRFGEHVSRDAGNYERHVDYLHDNPSKHGQVTRVADWSYSRCQHQVRNDVDSLEWGPDDVVQRLEME
jgi:putative transposase